MGMGDEIMATALARMARARDPRRVRIVGRGGEARWHEVWLHNPNLAQPHERGNFQQLVCGAGARPYVDTYDKTRWHFREWAREPGELYFTKNEIEAARKYAGCIIIDPHIKRKASPNKRWPWLKWSRLVALAAQDGVMLSQLKYDAQPLLHGAHAIRTKDLRQSLAVLSMARAAVLHEGGLHHAAAALGVPAVVIFGGFVAPRFTGYDSHINLFTGGEACGSRLPCDHCRDAMNRIEPQHVLRHLYKLLDQRKSA